MESFLERIKHLWSPHPGQREFLLNNSKTKVLACGRRWGKTDACAVQVIHQLTHPAPTRHFLVAPTLDQAKILFERILQLIEMMIDEQLGLFTDRPKVRTSSFP